MNDLLQKLEAIHFRFIEVGTLIVDPDIIADMKRYVKLNKEYKDLDERGKGMYSAGFNRLIAFHQFKVDI